MFNANLRSLFSEAQSNPESLRRFLIAFIEAFYGKAFAIASKYLRRKEDAEDVVQEFFEKLLLKNPLSVFEKIFQENAEVSDIDKWLSVSIRNACYTYYRLNYKRKMESFPDADTDGKIPGGIETPITFDEELYFEILLSDFPADIINILRLKAKNKKNRQIAETLGMKEGQVKMRWKRFVDNIDFYRSNINWL